MPGTTLPLEPVSKAVIYRMVMPGHTGPFGIKALDLLKRRGIDVEDHHVA